MRSLLKRWNLSTATFEFRRSVEQIGLRRTLAVAASRLADLVFDWRYGLHTVQTEALKDLAIESRNVAAGQRYQPTGSLALPAILVRAGIPRNGTFVDFGCGKGRTLILAALAGFKKVVGIEFSSHLCGISKANLDVFTRKHKSDVISEVHCVDASEYHVEPDQCVFYFFHPFNEKILEAVIERIEASIARHPRAIWLIYYLPKHVDVIAKRSDFKLILDTTIYGYECAVYCSNP